MTVENQKNTEKVSEEKVVSKRCKKIFSEIKIALFFGFWMVLLTSPFMAVKVDANSGTVLTRWSNLIYVFFISFVLTLLWRFLLQRRDLLALSAQNPEGSLGHSSLFVRIRENYIIPHLKVLLPFLVVLLLIIPWVFGIYHTNALFIAFLYIILGLGLNLIVGVTGLLHLGYAAFFAIGAYTYGLLYYHFGFGFWFCLPLAILNSFLWGILLSLPVLRLRGDYLAIVTLGFGEIVRLMLTSLDKITNGRRGITDIPFPTFFNFNLSKEHSYIFMYYLGLLFVVLTIVIVYRIEDSKIGRTWLAFREDEIACQAMGINSNRVKLQSLALGSVWAGLAGALLASHGHFIEPNMFGFVRSALILSIVVLGGMGSISGVILGALVLALLPEYLRAFSEYQPLAIGALMVIMMVFRPQGLIPGARKTYTLFPKK